MKRILFFCLLLYLTSCANFTRQMQAAAIRGNLYAVKNGVYLKDIPTGLCYFVIDAYQGASITLIPCDSLKNVSIKQIYINRQ